MKLVFLIKIFFLTGIVFSQGNNAETAYSPNYARDTIVIVDSDKTKGYYHSFILYIPEGTSKNKAIPLLVEPNNTGFVTDSIEVHFNSAINLASKSSVGNNVSRMLKIPLLVPVFPRSASQSLIYSHALDRDVMLEKHSNLERLDLQLLSMINDAKQRLQTLEVLTEEKILMTGFSASGTFVNRFSFFHPQIVKAVAIGGLNSKLMLPMEELKGYKLDYPLGINDFEMITGKSFQIHTFKEIPQFIYMGEIDDNDAVKFNDAYNQKEREIIFSVIGESMAERWRKSQEIYKEFGLNVQFRTYKEVGHFTTSEMLWDIIKFFQKQMSE